MSDELGLGPEQRLALEHVEPEPKLVSDGHELVDDDVEQGVDDERAVRRRRRRCWVGPCARAEERPWRREARVDRREEGRARAREDRDDGPCERGRVVSGKPFGSGAKDWAERARTARGQEDGQLLPAQRHARPCRQPLEDVARGRGRLPVSIPRVSSRAVSAGADKHAERGVGGRTSSCASPVGPPSALLSSPSSPSLSASSSSAPRPSPPSRCPRAPLSAARSASSRTSRWPSRLSAASGPPERRVGAGAGSCVGGGSGRGESSEAMSLTNRRSEYQLACRSVQS